MDGWEDALNSIIKTTEKNLVEFRSHSNPLVSASSWDKENMVSPMIINNMTRASNDAGYNTYATEVADLRALIQRTEAKLSSDIDHNKHECERNIEQIRQELRMKTAGSSGDLTHELWESTERRLLLLSEKIHVVESRMVAGGGVGAVAADPRLSHLETMVSELHNAQPVPAAHASADVLTRLARLEANQADPPGGFASGQGVGKHDVRRLEGMIHAVQNVNDLDDEGLLAQLSLVKQDVETCRVEAQEMEERLSEAETRSKQALTGDEVAEAIETKLATSLLNNGRRAEDEARTAAQLRDLIGCAKEHASRIEEQDGLIQQLTEQNKRLEGKVLEMSRKLESSGASVKVGELDHSNSLQESTMSDRAQLSHCCEMVVKLGNKSIEESQKIDKLTELASLIQQRLSEVEARLSEEKRERESLERELRYWVDGQMDADSSLQLSANVEPEESSFQLSELSPSHVV